MGEDHNRLLLDRCATSRRSQASCSSPNEPSPPAFRFRTLTSPRSGLRCGRSCTTLRQWPALCALAVALEVARRAVTADVVFPGTKNVFLGRELPEAPDPQCRTPSVWKVARCRRCEAGNAGPFGKRVDSRDRSLRRVAVTSVFAGLLKPMWLSLIWMKKRPPFCGNLGAETGGAGNTATDRPEHAGSRPRHAPQKVAPVNSVGVVLGLGPESQSRRDVGA